MERSAGEMPFLDHLEELRHRILRSLGALVVTFGIGFWLVQRFRMVEFLKGPIAPYLPDGRLTVLAPTDAVMITFKLAFIIGLVLASPIIIWQTWAFLSPALYERERKALVPALFAGLVLFLAGAVFSWLFVVPKALEVLFGFQAGAFNNMITYDAYFGFVLQIVLAMGLSSELPLLLIILTALGVTTPAGLGRFRRVAVVLSCVAGAFLSPGTDIISMLMMTVPLILLYEVGIAGAVVVHKRRLRREAALAALLILLLGGGGLQAQQPPISRRDSAVRTVDTSRVQRTLDSASARRLGLPSAPSRSFPSPDSVMQALMELEGYMKTRYLSDSASLANRDRTVRLGGHAITERENRILEAEQISYRDEGCDLVAEGDPRMFDGSQVMVGDRLRYDACIERGVVQGVLTTFAEQGANWILRANPGVVDSSSRRMFAGDGEITSCDLPVPHYSFSTKKVKWISRSMLVARPAVLYVRDVPIAWIPFIFQDTKPGRRSGILVPQFGFNDIVRPDPGYERQVTNAGYYWAANDYFDVAGRFDWYSRRYIRWSVSTQYNVLNRFFRGAVDYARQSESGGSVSQSIRWNHQQTFGITTTLAVSLDLATNSRVISDNAIDPLLNTQTLSSSANFTKRFTWGSLTAGGTRRQTLSDDQVTQDFPTLAISPKPIDFGTSITWSPTFSFRNQSSTQAKQFLTFPILGGGVDSVEQTPSSRTTTINFGTPLRLAGFNLNNTFDLVDQVDRKLSGLSVKVPNQDTPDPTDSLTVDQTLAGSFESRLEWQFGFNLPLLFRGSWKLTPSVGVANKSSGPFAIRNETTNGDWVIQGKRLNFGLSAAPTLFGFFGGIGPVSQIRHTFAPLINWQYSPRSTVSEEFARAVQTSPTQALQLESPARQTLTVSMSNTFEAKERVAPADTAGGRQPRKYRLLSINTSGVAYDFEQAKEPGLQGWATQSITNSILSDLLPGFNFSMTHDLWTREVSSDSAEFSPFLQNVSASFALSGRTFRSIGALFGLGSTPERTTGPERPEPVPGSYLGAGGLQQRTLMGSNQLQGARRPFSANINLTISRTRENEARNQPATSNSTMGFSTSFSPTRFWGVSWQTMYNFSDGEFDAHVVRLERDLHDWRAGFNFVKNPNGNFALYFSIHLIDLPDLKFDYNQTTIQP
jgi:sec-independent protein translocase protein TatC